MGVVSVPPGQAGQTWSSVSAWAVSRLIVAGTEDPAGGGGAGVAGARPLV